MYKKKLDLLLKKNEGRKLDFKQELDLCAESSRKELAKDVCAIANSRGGRGYLIIGVEDKTKKIIGVNKGELIEEKVQQIVSSRCDPPIPVSLEYIKIERKYVCVITVYNGFQKPYQLRENGVFYIRRGSTTDVMRKQEIVSQLQNNLNFNAEMCPIVRSSLEHLNLELIDKYLKKQGFDVNNKNRKSLMENVGIIIKDMHSNKYMATMGGLLVFSDVNSIYIPHNMIRIVIKLKGKENKVIFVKGTLLQMLDDCEKLLVDILPEKYPIEAVYEGIINAVMYRDYTIFDREIDVLINDKRIIVESPGVLTKVPFMNSRSYLRRNLWIYDKLLLLDDKKRFSNSFSGFTRMKKAFKNIGKVSFINSMLNNCFKVIYPGIDRINR